MTKSDPLNNYLFRLLNDLEDACDWLKRSHDRCKPLKEPFSKDDFDHFENLTSRFARVLDMLTQKVYRTVLKIELETLPLTMLDVLNAAHKRSLITDVSEIRTMKELRNQIAHYYSRQHIEQLFKDVLFYTPDLILAVQKVNQYSQQFR